MTRKKVKLAYITNDSARKATFKKRKKGLMKKVSELSTLCGIDACAIIYSPYDSQPEVWPSPAGAHRVLSKFKKMPEMEQSKKMVNQETFLRQRLSKARDQLKKQLKDNREKEISNLMYGALAGKASLHSLSLADLHDLGWLLDHRLKDIQRRMDSLLVNHNNNHNINNNNNNTNNHNNLAFAHGNYAAGSGAGENNYQHHHVATAGEMEVGMAAEATQSQRWLLELLNSNVNVDQGIINNIGGFGGGLGAAAAAAAMGGGGEEMNMNNMNMMLPLVGDGTSHGSNINFLSGLWSSAFFP